ncbi:MAG: HEAT repeat domain-containing protein [Aphanocapsa feldmannii 277cV]|uniref:HEAT repeat domain-containing protein n=2 Tax=Aphanocapsa feldmannii TaxID=192050 RepID=A0A524RPL3_9CHRO|nr:MAG: HEAT repeat domain-containing protein [Aphanocapsa feldmannii 288cV]TGG93778.1 MAG: HEAT repeat domain-containing protein [Aphanocapsa feldmannii 277cV]TGH20194.1 MAG: HEAT repeat domain-containing protein [Aphanocapsa feldmannii 277cI]
MSEPLEVLRRDLDDDAPTKRMVALARLRKLPAEQAFPLIRPLLGDPHPQVRSMAIWGIGLKPGPSALRDLLDVLDREQDTNLRAMAAGALGQLGDPGALGVLQRLFLEETEWIVRYSAIVSLGNIADPRAQALLLQGLEDDDALMHQAAISALGEIGAMAALPRLRRFCDSDDWLLRQRLAHALASLGSAPDPQGMAPAEADALRQQAYQCLLSLAEDDHLQVREAANHGLGLLQH